MDFNYLLYAYYSHELLTVYLSSQISNGWYHFFDHAFFIFLFKLKRGSSQVLLNVPILQLFPCVGRTMQQRLGSLALCPGILHHRPTNTILPPVIMGKNEHNVTISPPRSKRQIWILRYVIMIPWKQRDPLIYRVKRIDRAKVDGNQSNITERQRKWHIPKK